MGSERQSTEPGAAAAFGNATAQPADEVERAGEGDGSCAASGAEPRQRWWRVGGWRGVMLLPAPVEGNQPRRFRIGVLDDPRARARSRPADRAAAPAGRRRRRRSARGCASSTSIERHPSRSAGVCSTAPATAGRVREVERTARHETAAISFAIHAYGDAHDAVLRNNAVARLRSGPAGFSGSTDPATVCRGRRAHGLADVRPPAQDCSHSCQPPATRCDNEPDGFGWLPDRCRDGASAG